MAQNDLDGVIEQSHAALDAILKGNPEGYKALFSDREDVSSGQSIRPLRPRPEEGRGNSCRRGLALPGRRGQRRRTHSEIRLRRSRLCCRGGTGTKQGRRRRGTRPDCGARDEPVSGGERRLEAGSPARRPDHDASAGRVCHRQIEMPSLIKRDRRRCPRFDAEGKLANDATRRFLGRLRAGLCRVGRRERQIRTSGSA